MQSTDHVVVVRRHLVEALVHHITRHARNVFPRLCACAAHVPITDPFANARFLTRKRSASTYKHWHLRKYPSWADAHKFPCTSPARLSSEMPFTIAFNSVFFGGLCQLRLVVAPMANTVALRLDPTANARPPPAPPRSINIWKMPSSPQDPDWTAALGYLCKYRITHFTPRSPLPSVSTSTA